MKLVDFHFFSIVLSHDKGCCENTINRCHVMSSVFYLFYSLKQRDALTHLNVTVLLINIPRNRFIYI